MRYNISMVALFNTLVYEPLYNGLVFLIGIVPFAEVGFAVIVLTLIVKFVLFPLSLKAVKTQMATRRIEPQLTELKEKYTDNREEQARKMMALYKEEGINPFASFLVLLIQLPIIFGLYWVFFQGGLPTIDTERLYAFVSVPPAINMNFLGLIDMAERSIVLAVLAGATQFVQTRLMLPPLSARKKNPSLKDDLARSFQLQMRYVMPLVITVVAYVISSAVALYWVTSNLFGIGQELYVRARIRPRLEAKSKEA